MRAFHFCFINVQKCQQQKKTILLCHYWLLCVEYSMQNRTHLNTFQTHKVGLFHTAVKVNKTVQTEMRTIITPLSLLHSKDLIQLPWRISVIGLSVVFTTCVR